MIDKKHAKPAGESFFFRSHKRSYPGESGFVRYDVALGETFRRGDRFHDHRTTELWFGKTGDRYGRRIAYKFAPTHIYRAGDDTLHYVPLSELKSCKPSRFFGGGRRRSSACAGGFSAGDFFRCSPPRSNPCRAVSMIGSHLGSGAKIPFSRMKGASSPRRAGDAEHLGA